MSVLLLKQLFLETTGRYDLINTQKPLNAVFWINKAIKLLDKEFPRKSVKHVDTVAGKSYVSLPTCQSVHKVQLLSGNPNQVKPVTLERISFDAALSVRGTASGVPAYYSPGALREANQPTAIDWTWDKDESFLLGASDINGLILYPTPDKVYTIAASGYFYSKPLVDAYTQAEDNSNWWSTNHPELVMLAVQVVMGSLLNNREGVASALENLRAQLMGLQADQAEEEAYYLQEAWNEN